MATIETQYIILVPVQLTRTGQPAETIWRELETAGTFSSRELALAHALLQTSEKRFTIMESYARL